MVHSCLLDRLKPINDSYGQLRRHILWLLLIRVIFFTILIGITALLEAKGNQVVLPPTSVTIAFLAILFIYSVGSSAIVQKEGLYLRRFGLIQFLSDTFFAAILVYGTGCSQSIFTPVFILPVIAGGLIMYRKGGLMSAAAATLLYGSVLFLEYIGIIPPYMPEASNIHMFNLLRATNLFAIYGVTFFLTALLSGSLAARLRTTEEALNKTSIEFDRLTLLYKQIFEDISTGIITVDDAGIITSYNAAAGRITGYSPEEALGQSLAQLLPCLRLEKNSNRQVVDLTKKDGTAIRAGYSFSRLNLPHDSQKNDAICTNCKVITLQDISTVEEMEKRMREAEKMATIGHLSASIAHDFRNPLAAISGSAQLLALDEGGRDETEKGLTNIILRESRRMARTITDFLQFARPAPIQEEWFDLKRMVTEAIAQTNDLQVKYMGGLIITDIPEHLEGFGDRQQLQTVIMHLLENSTTLSREEDGPIIISGTEKNRKDQIVLCLEVIDKGPGISEAVKEKIFQPFFSTRENGTGLGLAVVQQIIEKHKGDIEVISQPEKGCTMRIFLPLPSQL